jgi:magnesium transporter
MLKTILCNKDNRFSQVENPEDISELIADEERLIWLDLAEPSADDFRLLRAEFGLHPLAIEDAMSRHQRPKVEQYEHFYFVVFYAVHCQEAPTPQRVPGRGALVGVNYRRSPRYHEPLPDPAHAILRPGTPGKAEASGTPQEATATGTTPPPAPRHTYPGADDPDEPDTVDWAEDRVVLREISMFMGMNWLITVHQEPIDELEEVQHRWQRNVEAITGQDVPGFGDDHARPHPSPSRSPSANGNPQAAPVENDIGILLYSLLDTIVDSYFPTIDALVDRVEALEEQIFERFNPHALESIFALKKDLLALRKVLAPERDVLNVLTRRDLPIFKTHTLVYFQDVYDHVVRITDSIDTYRDLLSSALDSYLSMQSNRLNITVQTLTSASIILMVLSLITGIYGTNFDNLPELHWTYGYFAMLGVMLALAIGLYAFFKRKGWL